jgi:hypothetical protein
MTVALCRHRTRSHAVVALKSIRESPHDVNVKLIWYAIDRIYIRAKCSCLLESAPGSH